MDDLDLLRLSTLIDFRLDPEGRLAPYSWTDPHDVPSVAVVRHSDGFVLYRRGDLDPGATRAVRALDPAEAFTNPAAVCRSLRKRERPRVVHRVEYRFPRAPNPAEFDQVSQHGQHFVAFDGGRPVAWAWTVAAHRLAAVGSVETVPEYRRQGLGRRVLGAWVNQAIHSGRLPLFRHPPRNRAAAQLARRLGAIQFADSVLYF